MPGILTPAERNKPWIPSLFDYKDKRVAVIGANGSAKSTYSFKFLFSLCIHKPRTILVTSGTLTQAEKLLEQKLRPMLNMIGFRKKNESKKEYELVTGTIIHVRSRENFETVEGIEYDAWFADEFQDHSKESAEMFLKRTRKARHDSMTRIVGLPEAPDSWIYEFLEQNGFTLHEISLFDHPDPEWVEYYEGVLRQLFHGNKLKRYLYGERVSVDGIGLFATEPHHKGQVPDWDPDKELYLYWDFNVEYRAVTVYQQNGHKQLKVGNETLVLPTYAVIESFQMKEPTVRHDAAELIKHYSKQTGTININGDASGENRTAAVTGSMWKQVRDAFETELDGKFRSNYRFLVPPSNPSVKDTIQAVNFVLMANLITFGDKAEKAYRSLSAMKADKYGEIDKKCDSKADGPKTHEADTVRYFCYHTYRQHLPGASNPFIA